MSARAADRDDARARGRERARGGEGGVPVFAGGGVEPTDSIATEFWANDFRFRFL